MIVITGTTVLAPLVAGIVAAEGGAACLNEDLAARIADGSAPWPLLPVRVHGVVTERWRAIEPWVVRVWTHALGERQSDVDPIALIDPQLIFTSQTLPTAPVQVAADGASTSLDLVPLEALIERHLKVQAVEALVAADTLPSLLPAIEVSVGAAGAVTMHQESYPLGNGRLLHRRVSLKDRQPAGTASAMLPVACPMLPLAAAIATALLGGRAPTRDDLSAMFDRWRSV